MQILKAILPGAVLCLGLASAAQAQYTYEWGGIKDANSDLVWAVLPGTDNYSGASTQIANHSVPGDGVTYDDWRLATYAEMQSLVANPALAERIMLGKEPLTPPEGSAATWQAYEHWFWTNSPTSTKYVADFRGEILSEYDEAVAENREYELHVFSVGQSAFHARHSYMGLLAVRSGATPAPPTSGGGGKPRK